MRAASLGWCLWPGLRRLWRAGDATALVAALGFAFLFNATLLVTFVWQEQVSVWVTRSAWGVLAVSWTLAWMKGRRLAEDERPWRASAEDEALFLQAQTEYLRGHWFESQSLLEKILARRSADIESRLLLATIYRRTKRIAEAEQQLDVIKASPEYYRWLLEVAQERRLLQRLATSATEGQPSGSSEEAAA